MAEYTCIDCSTVVTVPTLQGNPKRCSPCRTADAQARTRQWRAAQRVNDTTCWCERCGRKFARPASTGMRPRYCSLTCRRAVRNDLRRPLRRAANPYPDVLRHCEICGVEFARSGRASTKPYCPSCRRELAKARNASYRERHPGRIEASRAGWIARNPDYQRAEPTAEQLAHIRRQRVKYAATRRARQLGVGYEEFDPQEIFERDGWLCYLCGKPVDRDASWPDPRSVSLDHVIPLVAGGPHSRANTACTHLGCNVRKHAKIIETTGV